MGKWGSCQCVGIPEGDGFSGWHWRWLDNGERQAYERCPGAVQGRWEGKYYIDHRDRTRLRLRDGRKEIAG